MKALVPLIAVLVLIGIVILGVAGFGWTYVFGVIIPYIAIATFLIGFVYRIIKWAGSPVPFRITTTTGQQKSLPWIKSNNLESPHNGWGVIGRMALEILFFRSLFRNTRMELKNGPRLVYGSTKWLWAAGLAFHWSLLVIVIRHFKFFAEPVPAWVLGLQNLDGFFQVGLPIIYLTDIIVVVTLSYLFLRRVLIPQVRYISLPADYFPLYLIGAIVTTGILLRYFTKTTLISVKELATGLISLHPVVPAGIDTMFFIHLFMVSILLAYFPFSKLMHLGGVFMSPTRNLANNNRMRRHVNPWDYPVKVHTYEEYEDEFREVMKAADMPVEKE
ncbi:MAG: sulfate reduction electron transfer complex DsrMKJOP subunit DsrM [Candidatus Zixiibacteriota bacterium]|jgi:nitrate reductase gamma subunit